MGDPELAGPRDKLQDDARFRVLRLLEQTPEMSQRDLAQSVGFNTGSGPYVLKALVGKCLIRLGNFTTSEDTRRYAYGLTPKGISERTALAQLFLVRKIAENRALRAQIEDVSGKMSAEELEMIGTGYVGSVSEMCFSDFGHHVVCVDKAESKIAQLQASEVPTYEPGLDVVLARNVDAVAQGPDSFVILIEWTECRDLDLARPAGGMTTPRMADLRNINAPETATETGLEAYSGVAR